VTVGVREAGEAILDAEKQREGALEVAPVRNPHIAKLFPTGDRLFWITRGGCSCDLELSRHRGADESEIEKERARYRKKGWSEAKIARALQGKFAPDPRKDTPIEKLRELLRRLSRAPGGVRVFGHEYDGLIEEEVVVGSHETVAVDVLLEFGFAADTVVDVTSTG